MPAIFEAREALHEQAVGYLITRNYGVRANEAVNELVNHLVLTIFIIALILVPSLGWRDEGDARYLP